MELRQNRLKQTLREGGIALGCFLHDARDPGAIYAMADAGADCVVLELEHYRQSLETAGDLIAHAHGSGVTPLVYVPDVQYAYVTRILDAGCQSLIVPHLKQPEEVRHFLDLALYHPLGQRGIGGFGGASTSYQDVHKGAPDLESVLAWQNEQLLIGLIIETKEAVENLSAMLMPEIDFAIVGSSDLSQSYGIPGQVKHALITDAQERVRELCEDRGITYAAAPRAVEGLRPAVDAGARFLLHGGVLPFVRDGVRRAIAELS